MFSRKKRALISPPVTPCPDCDGRRAVVDGSLEMHLYRRGRPLSKLEGSVCLGCGRVWWYAVELEKLRESLPAEDHAG
jgi:uncharacterized protein with PIN domain